MISLKKYTNFKKNKNSINFEWLKAKYGRNSNIFEFNKWMDSIENMDELHNIIHNHGIFKYFNPGHQRFAWLVRTNQKIQNIFKQIWNTDELVTSVDG